MLWSVCAPTNNRQLAKRWAKGSGERRVHIPQSPTLANWSPRDVTAAQSRNGTNSYREFSHLGLLDFGSESGGTSSCVFACGIAV